LIFRMPAARGASRLAFIVAIFHNFGVRFWGLGKNPARGARF